MTPAIAAAIDAAIDLAWRPTANLPGTGYHERREAAERLCERLQGLTVPASAPEELLYLIAAMRRAAACSYANRMGHAYYERKQAIYELRGCLVIWQREEAA